MLKMAKRILIAGGGTGGHIFPAIAVAQALQRLDPSVDLLFVGALGKMEMEKVPQAGYSIEGINIAGFNRSSLIKNIGLPFKLVQSFFQVRRIVRGFRPDAVLGVGGYSSFPVLKYAQQVGIPTFLHESNAFAGKSNQWLGKGATRIFVATPGMETFFPADKIMVTGNPVRKQILQAPLSKAAAVQQFGLHDQAPVVLVTGGSLGAKSINESIAAGIEELLAAGLQVIWQTGKPFADQAMQLVRGRKGVWVGAFITEMQDAFAAADLVVSRAGAMAIAELCVLGLPVILVPYPHAAEDHQTVNAAALVKKGAAMAIADAAVGEQLIPAIRALAVNEPKRIAMKQAIQKMRITDADERIAQEILTEINK
jgi:UDP-N-acetylglucosamine--N-acetylmuramyl-(pentapeptide) pyrophosphoryl-undecaprenol N-acetylglucosamine transferase